MKFKSYQVIYFGDHYYIQVSNVNEKIRNFPSRKKVLIDVYLSRQFPNSLAIRVKCI